MKSTHPSTLLSICALVASLPAARAVDLEGIAIHGALSATGAYSDSYNYYGETDGKFDLIQKEVTLNGAYRFESGLRASAQIYAYELAGYSAITIDFANLDYSFRPEIGVRVGRNKVPMGFYSEIQDLDQVRTFASLPLAFYPRALRSLASGYNGGAIYGTIALGTSGGTIDYQIYGGVMNNISKDEPFSRGLATATTTPEGADLDTSYGIAPIWNTPVEGLRIGYTFSVVDVVSNSRVTAGPLTGASNIATLDVENHAVSAEYTRGKWVGVFEYKAIENSGTAAIPVAKVSGIPVETHAVDWYAQVSYQATDKIGFGYYHAEHDGDPKNMVVMDNKFERMTDDAVAVSYAVTSWCLVKAEYHLIDGLDDLGIAGDLNPGASDPRWSYLVLKTTVSF